MERVCATDKVRRTSGLAESRCLLAAVSCFAACVKPRALPKSQDTGDPKERWQRPSQPTLFRHFLSTKGIRPPGSEFQMI